MAIDIFLSHAGDDLAVAEQLYDALAPHATIFLDSKMPRGEDWMTSVPRALMDSRLILALVSARSAGAFYQRDEVAFAVTLVRRAGDRHRLIPIFLDGKPTEIPFGLSTLTYLEVAPGAPVTSIVPRLLEELRGSAVPQPLPRVEQPFRLLTPFAREDADLFFGRETAVRDLTDLVYADRLVVLDGESGTGKSSLLEAGLRPAVDQRFLWLRATPRGNLIAEIRRAVGEQLAQRSARSDESSPAAQLLALSLAAQRPVLLVIDQLEEVFQQTNEAQRREIAGRLAETIGALLAAGGGRGTVHVLLAVRADYFSHLRLLKDAGLRQVLENGLHLPPLDRTGTRRAIEEPFRAAGFSVNPKVVDACLRDLGGDKEQVVPVELEIVCVEMLAAARRMRAERVGPELLDALGGTGRVLRAYLDRALASLESRRSQGDAVLVALIGPEGVRLPASSVDELAARTTLDAARVAALASYLEEHRLLARVGGGAGEAPRYRLSHDLVAREVFARLSEIEKTDLALGERVKFWAEEWRARRGSPGRLPAREQDAIVEWAQRHPQAEREFVAALLRQRRRKAFVRRWVAPAVVLLALATIVPAIVAVRRQLAAARAAQALQEKESEARALLARSSAQLDNEPRGAMGLLRLAARELSEVRRARGLESETDPDALKLAVGACRSGTPWQVLHRPGPVAALAFSPLAPPDACRAGHANRTLAAAWADGVVRLFDLTGRRDTVELVPAGDGVLRTREDALVSMLEPSPNGRWLAGKRKSLFVWDLAAPDRPPRELGQDSIALAWTPDSRFLVDSDRWGHVRAWSADNWVRSSTSALPELHAWGLNRFHTGPARGATLVYPAGENELVIVDVAANRVLTRLSSDEKLGEVATSENAVAATASDRTVRLFRSPFQARPLALPVGDEALAVDFLSTDAEITILAAATLDGRVLTLSPDARIKTGTMALHAGAATWLAPSRVDERLLAAWKDGTVALASLDPSAQRTPGAYRDPDAEIALSPDGRMAAYGTQDGFVSIWDSAECGMKAFDLNGAEIELDPKTRKPLPAVPSLVYEWRDRISPFGSEWPDGIPGWLCPVSGDRVAFAPGGGEITVWSDGRADPVDRTRVQGHPYDLACVSDGKRQYVVWIERGDKLVHAWSPGEAPRVMSSWGAVRALAASPSGRRLAALRSEHEVVLISDVADAPSSQIYVNAPELIAVSFYREDELAVSNSNTVRFYRVNGVELPPRVGVGSLALGEPRGLAVSGDARLIAVGRRGGGVDLYVRELAQPIPLRYHPNDSRALSFSTDGTKLMTIGDDLLDGKLVVWMLPPTSAPALDAWLDPARHWQRDPTLSALPPRDCP